MKGPIVWTLAALGGALSHAPVPRSASATPLRSDCGCKSDAGERRHDGFLARSESGVALLSEYVSDSGVPPFRSRVRGVGQSASLSLGGTPAKGLVLGGTLWTARIDPVFVEDGKVRAPDDDSVKVLLLRVGPLVDWYPHPRRGFHASGSAALTLQVETDTKGNAVAKPAYGASVATAAGHEWFLSSELSLGILGRFTFGGLAGAAPGGPQRTLLAIPEAVLTVTYH